jgi:ABC-2 type transport system permease protein
VVAVLLRLRFRTLANTLQRNTFQLVAVTIGGMLAASLALAGLAAMLVASVLPPPVTQAVVIVAGSTLLLGWIVVPLLFDGVDRTLDPPKLARFPLRTSTLMAATLLVGATWIPGIATIVVSIGIALAWRADPPAAIAAVPAGLVGAATCIAGAQLTTSVVGALLRGRGAARAAVAVLGILVFAVPLGLALRGAERTRSLPGIHAALDVLGWSPFGAAWSIPGRIALGDTAGAALAGLIAIATLAGILALWRLALHARTRVRGSRPARGAAAGRLGILGRVPSTATGAVLARSLTYWFRDARQARQLILVPVLPALMLIGPVVAALLPLSAFATLSYDGTAFASELMAGVRGLHDRLGRALALLVIAVPATVVVQVVVAAVVGLMPQLPALLGLSLGILLVAVGVVSVSSAQLVVPVARPGRNPFSAQAGAATTSIFASYLVAGATVLLTLPVAALTIRALATDTPSLGWPALGVGTLVGVGVTAGGVVWGGRILDASAPEMLARLRAVRV